MGDPALPAPVYRYRNMYTCYSNKQDMMKEKKEGSNCPELPPLVWKPPSPTWPGRIQTTEHQALWAMQGAFWRNIRRDGETVA